MNSHLTLFADTNVFVQCIPLEQADWAALGRFANIDILITRPVQAEIDSQKAKGSGRLARRARNVSSIIRNLLESETGFLQLQSGVTDVKLFLRQDLKKDDTLADDLDYTERDDQLVGIAFQFRKNNPQSEVRLLTHDTGPMASAKLVGLPYTVVPDSWLLPPETDESDKRANAMDAELQRYKRAEPNFQITCASQAVFSREGNMWFAEIERYTPLTLDEVKAFLARLKTKFPMAAEFGPEEKSERPITSKRSTTTVSLADSFWGSSREVYTPVTRGEIEAYRERHAAWLRECEAKLVNLHAILNASLISPELSISISNVGSRPAQDALIVFETEGGMKIMPPPSEDEAQNFRITEICLPDVPTAPQGSWRIGQSPLESLALITTSPHPYLNDYNRNFNLENLVTAPIMRDPNLLYWKPTRPILPVSRLELECRQWRHLVEEEIFDFFVLAPNEAGNKKGILTITVHAANLTNSAQAREILRLTVKELKSTAKAEELLSLLGA